jgi:hypothetical protein
MRFKGVLALAGLAALVVVSAVSAASMPAGGAIRVFVTPALVGNGGTILITGAIGDYGRTTMNPKTDIGKTLLKKGTFEVNLAYITKKSNTMSPSFVNTKTCSYVFDVNGPAALMNGTGLYTGIHGTVMLKETFAGIAPLYKSGPKKGQCNLGQNVNPIAQYGAISGVGTVKFT